MTDVTKIGLAQFLQALRTELDQARTDLKNDGKDAFLDLENAEVEIHFVVEKEAKSGLDVDIIGLFALEAGGKYHTENIHKLKLKLKPRAGVDAAVAGPGSGE